jgi:hypothetical protein
VQRDTRAVQQQRDELQRVVSERLSRSRNTQALDSLVARMQELDAEVRPPR